MAKTANGLFGESTTQQPRHDYRPDIDGLRAVAVLSVVAFHAFPRLFPGGFLGVDIFFVISGYLIGGIILRELNQDRLHFANFYLRRVRRIFPSLIIVLLFCLAFGHAALLDDEMLSLGKHVAGGAGFLSNFILWKESGYFDVASELKPLLHLWFLGIEEQFYLFLPALLFFGWRLGRSRAAGITLAGIAASSLVLCVVLVRSDPIGTLYSP